MTGGQFYDIIYPSSGRTFTKVRWNAAILSFYIMRTRAQITHAKSQPKGFEMTSAKSTQNNVFCE